MASMVHAMAAIRPGPDDPETGYSALTGPPRGALNSPRIRPMTLAAAA